MKNLIECCFPSKKEEVIKDIEKDCNISKKEKVPEENKQKDLEIKEEKAGLNVEKQQRINGIENIILKSVNKEKEHINNDINNDNTGNKKENNENNDPLYDYIKNNREISEEEINNSTKLILEEIEGGTLFGGKKIEIDAGGMIGGRGVKDGVTIFSLKNSNENTNDNNNIFKPDFKLNYSEKLNYPYVFAIYYNKECKTYNIRAYLGKESNNRILFIKLTNKYNLPIKQKELFSAGNIIFQVTPLDNSNIEVINLSKRELNSTPKQTFNPSTKKEITIGRSQDCDFSFPGEKSFSRRQTTFEYNEENKEWKIIDGSKNKSSTNGTWVFGTHSFPIKEELTVEILTSKVKITELQK